ncbi:hypothetical protein RND81_14G095100 [Saponaria officinalis]|uniref:SWIM-type domain-containing protein n=1 Tax=Saponaria officinalis TaxID=3572 RepID=A0AAW1GNE6_SAPOF
MICAPFVGVNHHGNNVMFGCAFLLDEKTDSLIWLFRNFLYSMGDKVPKTIFTDQDKAIMNAIDEVFPQSRHRLCQWHIWKKVTSYLGALSKDRTFMSQFYSCFDGVESSDEFEMTWQKMIVDFQLEKNSWPCSLYKLRNRWSAGLSNDVFSAGILSTQRSESTNHVLNDISTTTTGLTIWVRRFENLVDGWRKKESNEDFRCKHESPFCEINIGLIKHAKRAYTINMFTRFKIQYILMLEMTWKELDSDGSTTMYEVKGEEIDENEPWVMKSKRRAKASKGDNIKVRTVTFDKAKSIICCTCKMFETEGILCRHTLKILSL